MQAKPIEVFAIDGLMNRATGSIPYTSLTWHRRYYEPGEFSMVIPASLYDPSWRFIETDERPETGIIQKVEYTDTPTYGSDDTVTVSGFFLESILNRHTFLDETPEQVTERYYVSPPSPPSASLTKPKIYTANSDGKYWYSTPGGTSYGVADGTPSTSPDRVTGGEITDNGDGTASVQVAGTTIQLTEVSYGSQINSYYYEEENGVTADGKIFRSQLMGDGEHLSVHNVAFDDGNGNVWYHEDDSNVLKRATGVTTKASENYTVKRRKWRSTTDNGWVTVTKTVKGPWQTTDALDPVTPADNIKRCVQWAQMYFQNEILFEEPEITGETKAVNPSFMLLGDLLYQELQTVGASFRLEYDFPTNQFVFSVWRGTDRTQSQNVNPWAVFSDTWGSLYGFTASRDESNYRNTCYVLYDYDVPTAWTSDGRPALKAVYEWNDTGVSRTLIGYQVPYTTKRGFLTVQIDDGLDARETYLDLRNSPPAGDGEWSRQMYDVDSVPTLPSLKDTYDAYEAGLESQGMAKLTNDYPVVTSLDTGDLDLSRYLADYDLGDLVDMSVSTVGLEQAARIIGVVEVYEAGKSTVTLEIGEKQLTILEKARLN